MQHPTLRQQKRPPQVLNVFCVRCVSVRMCCSGGSNACPPCCFLFCFVCSPAVVVVRGAGSPPPAASPEEPAERAAGKSPHAAQHEQHEARPHSQVSGGHGQGRGGWDFLKLGRTWHLLMHRKMTCNAFRYALWGPELLTLFMGWGGASGDCAIAKQIASDAHRCGFGRYTILLVAPDTPGRP